jgi:hypothetical protein
VIPLLLLTGLLDKYCTTFKPDEPVHLKF